jgi:ABC-type multidrug transport system fused ATPase/permease subunit
MTATVRRIVAVLGREQAGRYAGLLALMLVSALMEAIGVGAVLPFLGAVSQPESVLANAHVQSAMSGLGLRETATHLVVAAGVAIIVVFTLKGLIVLVSTWLQGQVLHRQRARLSRMLFEHYLHLPYELYLGKNSAHLIHVIVGVTANFINGFMASLMPLVAELLVVLTITAMLLAVSPAMTAVAAAFMLVVGGGYMLWGKARLTRAGRDQHAATLALNKSVMEGLGSLKEARVMGVEDYFLERFDALAHLYTRYATQLHVLNNAPKYLAETLFVAVVVGAVIVLSLSGRDLRADLPVIVLFGMAAIRLLPSFSRILGGFTGARVHVVALNTLFEELSETSRDRQRLPPRPSATSPGPSLALERSVRLEGVSFAYPGQQSKSLQGITLEIGKGEIIAFVGKSGAGKTTLVDVVLGLLEPQEGRILVDGAPLSGRQKQWRRLIGYIPQSIYLTDDSIRRNIAFGVEDRDIDEAALRKALEASQLSDFVATLEQGLDTHVGERGIRLSGGQRQRIGIARALYRDPELLILDEATSALDVETESEVNEAIRRLGRRKTLIVIAHRLTTVMSCDRLYLIDEGRLADTGTYAQLAEHNAWFRRINEILA